MKDRKVLVAGGTGLVGANLALRLDALGADLLATWHEKKPRFLESRFGRFDFTRYEDCVEATRGREIVFICAAQTFGAQVMKDRPTALVLPNLQVNAGLLEACRVNGVDRVVFMSSSTVYQEAFYPIREDELDLNKPVYPMYQGVAWMKRYTEELCRFYAHRYGMKIGIIRPTNIYGPWDKFDPDKAHVLPALINRALRRENPFVVWGTGATIRDFIYVDDMVDIILQVAERHCACDPVNVATGSTIRIREAVGHVLAACGHDVEPVFDATKPDTIPYRMLSTVKLSSLFGDRSWVPFSDGIRRVVSWYRDRDKGTL